MQPEQFRGETRQWLEENCPESMRTPMPEDETIWGGRNQVFKNPDSKVWLDRMAAKGWTAPQWPKEYGGGGLNAMEAAILRQELGRIKARQPLMSFGIWMLGPALLEYASEEQKKHYLPQIIRGEIRWCQGYSEPGAGSDLAGLQTRAENKGDHYLVNGQKIWTSYANYSDWMFCLVRTDPDVPKHNGISFVLFDMQTAGVETRPIELISGSSPFCETFLTDVKVPKENLVGKEGTGWTIAKALLQHERTMIGGMGGPRQTVRDPSQIAEKYVGKKDGKLADDALRTKIARLEMDTHSFALTTEKFMREAKAGRPGPAASMFKYYGTEMNKRRMELMLEVMGTKALGWEGEGFAKGELDLTRTWLRSKGNSIEGGTTEVQLNIISKRVLGLPDGSKK